jgi:hypothetical protein
MSTPASLPTEFNSLNYIDSMTPVVGLHLDTDTRIEVSKLLDVAHAMATVVYSVDLDDNEFDMAAVYTPGKHHD